jgi:hypothetical protein
VKIGHLERFGHANHFLGVHIVFSHGALRAQFVKVRGPVAVALQRLQKSSTFDQLGKSNME